MNDFLETMAKALVISFIVFISVALMSLISGTIVWLIWPVAIPSVFPDLVSKNIISGELSWWSSVCLSWLMGILFRTTIKNKTNDD
jgi:hypothetical protein